MTQSITRRSGLDYAADIAIRAAHQVDAYAQLLQRAGIDPESIRGVEDFSRLPIMTKDNYLSAHPLPARVGQGQVSTVTHIAGSSGSTGKYSLYGRGKVAREQAATMFDRIFTRSYQSHTKSTLLIVGFAMGTWIGGVYTLQASDELIERGHLLTISTPGIDADAIIRDLGELGPFYEQVVIAGYPPFVKDVLDQAPDHVLAQEISLLLAGEAITESWRDHVLDRLGRPGEAHRICLKYGTADAGLMGYETPETIAIRRAAALDPHLNSELFGACGSTQPTFVEYHPEFRYVETDRDDNLLFTVDGPAPLIRYRINDRGRVFDGIQLRNELHDLGYTDLAHRVEPTAHFLVLSGRPDVAAIFYSLNVYPDNLRLAFDDTSVTNSVTGRFAIETTFDDDHAQTLTVRVELGAHVAPSENLRARLTARCLAALIDTNSEYRALHAQLGERAEPTIELHLHRSPGFGDGVKQTYIRRNQ